MSAEPSARWESGALAHGVADPFAVGPLPWMRGTDQYVDDRGRVMPWYVDTAAEGLPGELRGAGYTPGQRPGTADQGRPRSADDVNGQIKGWGPGSVAHGETLGLRVSVNPGQRFGVNLYRVGHFDFGPRNPGARHMQGLPLASGGPQAPPLRGGRTNSCHHWWINSRVQIPGSWSPGAYVAVLTTADRRFRSHVPFTLRSETVDLDRPPAGTGADADAHADPARRRYDHDLLLLLPDVTWQAYNLYPENGHTGASLYHAWDEKGELLGEDQAATTVSFDRPYAGAGLPLHIGHAYDVIRWAERNGYDIGYANATDLHAGRVDPARYRAVVFPGHDEYWSEPMRRAVVRARDAGTSLVFLSANSMYWRVELEPGPDGTPDRLMTCAKRQVPPGRPHRRWRDLGEPEQSVMGLQYAGRVPEPVPLVARNTDHWLWQGTGVTEGERIEGLVAGESDHYFPRVPLPESTERALLAHSPYRDSRGVRRHQETSLYRAPSGAWVFASGTFAWSPALDREGSADPRIQQATANLLRRIIENP